MSKSVASSAPQPDADGHGTGPVSSWVQRWSHLVPPGGRVLDLACGKGRHTRWFLERGHAVTAVDRSAPALDAVRALGGGGALETLQADIENEPWPLNGRTFDAVVVTNYLWRPLLGMIAASVAPGGVLIYETFAAGNEAFGRPARPDFLLQPGELLAACIGLQVVAYEHGFLPAPARVVQRIAAVRPQPDGSPARFALESA